MDGVDVRARVMLGAAAGADVVLRLSEDGAYAYQPDALVLAAQAALIAVAVAVGQLVRERSDEDGVLHHTVCEARRAAAEIDAAIRGLAEDG